MYVFNPGRLCHLVNLLHEIHPYVSEGNGNIYSTWFRNDRIVGCLFHCFCLLLFYSIATLFQLYLDGDLMNELRRKPAPTCLAPAGLFKSAHNVGMV